MAEFDKDSWDAYLKRGRKGYRKVRVFKQSDRRCFYCGLPLRFRDVAPDRDWVMVTGHNSAILEHKIPVCRGGKSNLTNCVPACVRCNREKGAFTVEEFRLARGLRAGSLNY